MKAILECILFCCQQGLPLRGHREMIDTEDSSINIGNFRSLVVLQSRRMISLGIGWQVVLKMLPGLGMTFKMPS